MKRQLVYLMLLGTFSQGLSAQVNPFSISEEGLEFEAGKAIFEKVWVSPPSSTEASDGLGPLYNARSCAECHINAGRGTAEDSLIVRINHADFGRQLQPRAVPGLPAESQIVVSYTTSTLNFADGTTLELRTPSYLFPELSEAIPFSARVAPSLAGIGQIGNIPYIEIVSRADPRDRDEDGISGRPGAGRFGWKAEIDSLAEQVGLALSLDIGISSTMFPDPFGDCSPNQQDCLRMPHGASEQHQDMEIGLEPFYSLVNFVRQIPAPTVSRNDLPGESIFNQLGCTACHAGGYGSGTLNPYSDLLLHDMGEGLADNMDNNQSQEWRTAPLWGLSVQVQGESQNYLHDGRARNLLEAIAWHGGEAEQAQQAFLNLSEAEREDLITFLQSL